MVDLSVTPEQVRSRSNIWLLCSYHVGIRRQEEVPEAPPPGITFPADAGMLIAPTPGGMAKLSWPETVAYPSTNQVTRRVTLTKPRPSVNTLFLPFKLCGRVPDLQSGSCGFESRPGLLRIKVYSAFHPSGVGKWVPVIPGKAKTGMAHSDCGWTYGCAGKTEIPWEHAPYLIASAVVIHYQEALYQVYAPLPLLYAWLCIASFV